MSKYKLAFLISHPIQYQTPFFKRLAQHPAVDLTVYYCTDFGVTARLDPGFGVGVKWDRPALEGYKYKFLRNYSPAPDNPSSFFWNLNPAIVSELFKKRYDAVIIHGYNYFTIGNTC